MGRLIDTLQLRLALAAVLCSGALFAAGGGAEAARAPAPRVVLSVPAEVTQATPAVAKGRVVPAEAGRVLLQAWKAGSWRTTAAGSVRGGRFRISFVMRQATPTVLRMRATLLHGRRSVGSSPARMVHIRPAQVAPESTPSPPAPPKATNTAPGSAVAAGETPPTEEPPPGEEEPPNEEPPGEEEPPPAPNGLYWGAWIGSQLTGEEAPWDMDAVSEFEQLVGKPLSLLEFSSPFADCATSPCSDYTFPAGPFDSIRAHGAIPFFSWGSQSLHGSGQTDFQLADIIAGDHDSYIHTWATRAAEWGHPFFLRFDWEMNGNWFAWGEGANGNQPGEFVKAWRHVHDIFTSAGATNATWVWCPYVNRLNLYAGLYPGDSYVDWTCLDGYNWGTNPAAPYGWASFNSLYASAYDKVTEEIAPSKPMVIGEIAASEFGGSKSAWIEEMFEALETGYSKIRALVWFEKIDNSMDWPLESSESATDAFATGIGDSRFRGNEFGGIGSNPIPVP